MFEMYKKRLVSRINPECITKDYFTKHINIKTNLKQKLFAKVNYLIKLGCGWRDLLV